MAALKDHDHDHDHGHAAVLEKEDIEPGDDERVPVTVLTGFLGSKFFPADMFCIVVTPK
jgi:hypothetical protein